MGKLHDFIGTKVLVAIAALSITVSLFMDLLYEHVVFYNSWVSEITAANMRFIGYFVVNMILAALYSSAIISGVIVIYYAIMYLIKSLTYTNDYYGESNDFYHMSFLFPGASISDFRTDISLLKLYRLKCTIFTWISMLTVGLGSLFVSEKSNMYQTIDPDLVLLAFPFVIHVFSFACMVIIIMVILHLWLVNLLYMGKKR